MPGRPEVRDEYDGLALAMDLVVDVNVIAGTIGILDPPLT
jgi:hypothetical protein